MDLLLVLGATIVILPVAWHQVGLISVDPATRIPWQTTLVTPQ